MMRIRAAENEPADVMRIAEMTLRFLTTTPYGAIVGFVNPNQLGKVIGLVVASGVILLAEVSERPAGCARFEVDEDRPLLGPDARCATCGQAAQLHHPAIAGFCAIYKAVHPLSGRTYGDELAWWVEPEYRNSTVGHRLLCAAEEWARQEGLSVLKMVAPAGSKVADYYTRRGYTFVESVFQKSF